MKKTRKTIVLQRKYWNRVLFLALFSIFLSYSNMSTSIWAQTAPISISFENTPVKQAIEKVSQVANVKFNYSKDVININYAVTFSIRNGLLKNILDKMFLHRNIEYKIDNNNIYLYPKKDSKKAIDIVVNGVVKDDNGEPVIGANIIVKGTTKGTITNTEGRFSLTLPTHSTIAISYIGYVSQEIKVDNSEQLTIKLTEDSKRLEEVVVVGYGTVRKSDLTGSIASIKAGELTHSAPSLGQSLVGHTPGVEVKQTSGAPGASSVIRIRGVNSIYSGVEPLYVIDGYPTESQDINPADIESIEVLKDAASAAIYGSRAAGGVIIITTKRGAQKKAKVEYDYQFSTQTIANKMKLMNATQFRDFNIEAYNNAYADFCRMNGKEYSPYHTNAERSAIGAPKTAFLSPEVWDFETQTPVTPGYNSDWQDALFSNAPMHRHNFIVSGGTKEYKYMFSLGYLNQDGIVEPSNYKRFTARLNMDIDLTDRLQIAVNSSVLSQNERRLKMEDLPFNDGIMMNTLGASPLHPIYNTDGSYALGYGEKAGRNFGWHAYENPLALAQEITDSYNSQRANLNAELRYKIIDGLMFKVNGGLMFSNLMNKYYRPAGTVGSANKPIGDFANLARSKNSRNNNLNWLVESMFTYNKKIKKHNINGLLGFSAQKSISNVLNGEGQGYTSDIIQELSGAGSNPGDTNANSNYNDWAMMSYFGRAVYSYDSRYSLSASLRTDGCSRFGPENRWGIFPSVSGGWNISNERFFEPISSFLTAKLRVSWGLSGNNNIGNYEHIALMSSSSYPFGGGMTTLSPAYFPTGFTDSMLGWEKTSQTNVGLDLGLFKNRLNIIANYYYSKTRDLLYNQTVSAVTGSTSFKTNLEDGCVINKGFDIQFDGAIIAKKDWRWNLGVNFSFNRNSVDGLSDEIILKANRSMISHITRNGSPIGSFYGMVSDGIIRQADYEKILIDKQHQNEPNYKLQGPAVSDYEGVYVGDVKWRDVNGDNKITEDDREIIGDSYPDFTFGINTSFSWKSLTLSATFNGQYGGEVINFSRYYIGNLNGGVNTILDHYNKRYIDENNPGQGVYRANRVPQNKNTELSTYFVEDASYLRCANITLNYVIPSNLFFKKLKVSTMNVYISADNLFTCTKYTGYNPEVDNEKKNIAPGVDFGTYPLAKSFSVGAKISF